MTFYPAQEAEHRILGLEHRFSEGVSLRVEGYQRLLAHPLPEYRSLENRVLGLTEVAQGDRVFLEPEEGRAQGVEVSLNMAGPSPFSWSVSYALAESEERIGGEWYPTPYDQRHAVNLSLAYRPTPDWAFTTGWVYHSPWPFTGQSFSEGTTVGGSHYVERTFDTLNQERLPTYRRLDLRASRWIRTGKGDLLIYLDVFNLTNRENATSVDYRPQVSGGEVVVREDFHTQLPIMPSIGFSWSF